MKVQLYRYTHADGRTKDWGIAVERVSHPGLGTESGVRVWFGKTGNALQSRFIQADNPDGELCKRVRHKSHQGYQLVGDVDVDEHTGMVMATVSTPSPEPVVTRKEEASLYWQIQGPFMALSDDKLTTLATETSLTLERDDQGFTLLNPVGTHGLTRLCFPKTQTMAGVLVVPVLKDNPLLLLALLSLGQEAGVCLRLADEQGYAIEPALNVVLDHFGLGLNADQKACAQRLGLLPQPLGQQPSFYFGGQSGQLSG